MSVPLSGATRAAWKDLFAGQAERVKGLLDPVRAELDLLPEGAVWNGWFESGDAETYYALLRHAKPARVVELGSGHSSGLAARALLKNGHGQLTCIDPAPRTAPPASARHVASPWQTAPAEARALGPGDVLFVDSSHEAEEALECYLLFDAVPPGAWVHIHDILYPHPPRFPEENLVLSYFALRKERWEGVAALALLHHELGPRGMLALFPSGARAPERVPGSVWLRRRAGP